MNRVIVLNQTARLQQKGKRTPIIAGNWKMNKTVGEALTLVDDMLEDLEVLDGVDKVICPSFVALYPVLELLEETHIWLGAQDMHWEEQGAFTGEVSPLMLRDICDFVIIGHSERRHLFGEIDMDVNRKVKAAIRHDIVPIIAIGENLAHNEIGQTNEIVTGQLRAALNGVAAEDAVEVVIAYEPIWAIGSGKAANGEYANQVATVIRQILAELYSSEVAEQIRIQYGGSVTAKNIEEFMLQPEIDGALVGGASLKAAEFIQIVAKTLEVSSKK